MMLERRCDPNVTDNKGITCMHLASFQGHGSMAWYLYTKGAWKNRLSIETGASQAAAGGRVLYRTRFCRTVFVLYIVSFICGFTTL